MSTKRTLRLSNIRAASKFTGERDDKYYYSSFANASGPVPDGFDLNKYNALTSNPNSTVASLQVALQEVTNAETEYTIAQANPFIGASARVFLPTIKMVKKEIIAALSNAQNRTVASGGSTTGNAYVPGSEPNTQTSKWSTTKIVLTTVASAVALGGIFILIKWIKNK